MLNPNEDADLTCKVTCFKEKPKSLGYFKGKVVLIGDQAVGKTYLVGKWVSPESEPEIKPTLGVEFHSKIVTISGQRIKAQVWDTAGQERYRAITSNRHYRKAVGGLLVFDLTNEKSFASLEHWYKELTMQAEANIKIVLIGNKADLPSRRVGSGAAQTWAQERRLKYFETSALMNMNVDESFQALLQEIANEQPHEIQASGSSKPPIRLEATPMMIEDQENHEHEQERGPKDKSSQPHVHLHDLQREQPQKKGCCSC